jgi:hypothetical protein
VMPLFLLNNTNAGNVASFGGVPATDRSPWVSIAPGSSVSALVATGGYEILSTYFKTDDTYAPNALLEADSGNGSSDAHGRIRVATAGTGRAVVGIVSRGKVRNANGVEGVAFWAIHDITSA